MHLALLTACLAAPLAADPKPEPRVDVLFDFEDAAGIKDWSNLELPDAKVKEPPVKIELSPDHATSGKQSLKLTFAGGEWPTVTTTKVPDDWTMYQTFKADVTASRPCLVGFTVMQETSTRERGWDGGVGRWTKTELLKPGTNEIVGILHPPNEYALSPKRGKVVRFEIFMYTPHDGESIYVDNIRISTAKEEPPPAKTQFKVLGTDWDVSGVQELGKKLKDQWTKPTPRTVEQVERDFRANFDELRKKHPGAVLAVLRDGEKGGDPTHPDQPYMGWKDAYWSSHGPDGLTIDRAENRGKDVTQEIFMRHRSPLMQVDFSCIPQGSQILAAQLVVVRSGQALKDNNGEEKPNMWVAEPCNRPWEEDEVNAYQYAKDKFWKAIGGMYYGDDPDFLPVYVAHGPGGGQVSVWDFTEAVRFWTDGKHLNHGFMLHGDSFDYIKGFTREAAELKDRPAVLAAYVPK
jgi:hypothetical protein